MKVKWLGHSCFLFEIKEKNVLIDPFIDENPKSPIKSSELKRIDVLLITHDHRDHLGDAFKIERRLNPVTVAVYEFANWLKEKGFKKVIPANVGGVIDLDGLRIKITPALHSCKVGRPVGYILMSNGETIYHAGDTEYMPYMKFIGETFKLKVACLPIGGHYTMGVNEAFKAVSDLKPKVLIPMHYDTFKEIETNVNEFKERIESEVKVEVIVLKPGEEIEV